jgi:gliding motility-associated-like protein
MRNFLYFLGLTALFLVLPGFVKAQVIFQIDTISVDCAFSDTVSVPIRVKNFNNIGGVQFTVKWDIPDLSFDTIYGINPLFENGNFSFNTSSALTQNGELTFNWIQLGGLSVPDETILFAVVLKRNSGGFPNVDIDDAPGATTPIFVINNQGDFVPFSIIEGGIRPLDFEAPSLNCPANVNVSAPGPVAVPGLAPVFSDNCAINQLGWVASAPTSVSAPNDPDASGQVFSVGTSTVTYTIEDVGGNINTCSFTVTVTASGPPDDSLRVIANSTAAACGQSFYVDITAFNFDSLGGIQFSVNWPLNLLEFDSVGAFNPDLNLDSQLNFGYSKINEGKIGFSWLTTNFPVGNSLPQGASLFRIYFTVIGNSSPSANVVITGDPTTLFAIDALGNQIPLAFNSGAVAISDNVPPQIVCPSPGTVTAQPGQTSAIVNGLEPLTLTDNCPGNVGLSYTPSNVGSGNGSGPANGVFPGGTTVVTYTATDVAGNTATCSFQVTVDIGEVFEFTAANVVYNCNGVVPATVSIPLTVDNFDDIVGLNFRLDWDPAVIQYTGFSSVAPGLTGVNASSFFQINTTAPQGYLQFVALTTNPAGWPNLPDGSTFLVLNFNVLNLNGATGLTFSNTSAIANGNGTFPTVPSIFNNGNFSSADLTPPVITCPSNVIQNAPQGSCVATVDIPEAIATDGCSGVDTIFRTPAGNVFNAGNTTVTFTAVDNSGNSSTCTMVVTVVASTIPVISNCPSGQTVSADPQACGAIVTWTPPTAADACGTPLTPTVFPFGPGEFFNVGSTQVTYTANDGNGNTATCTFIIVVNDVEAPEVLNCPTTVTIDALPGTCCAPGGFQIPQFNDLCDVNLDISSNFDPGDSFCVGSTQVAYFASDDFGNVAVCSFNVVVKDVSEPTFSFCPDTIQVFSSPNNCGNVAIWQLPQATDLCDAGALQYSSNYDPGDFFGIGCTQVQYTATDNAGNVGVCTFQVCVTDNILPTITCPADIVVELSVGCDTTVTWPNPASTASDNCGLDDITSNFLSGSNYPVGTTTVVYTVSDDSGNTATCAFDITVNDNVAPIVSNCPSAPFTATSQNSCPIPVNWTFPTFTDNCTAPADLVIQSAYQPGGLFPVGNTTFIITATDISGNSVECEITVSVLGIPPGFDPFPNNITVNGCAQTVTWPMPVAVGICDLDTVLTNIQPGSVFQPGTTVVYYYAIDSQGDSVLIKSFTVNVVDDVAPALTCPQGPIVVNVGGIIVSNPGQFLASAASVAGCDGAVLNFSFPAATDNCILVEVQQQSGGATGSTFPVGNTTLQFVATDGSGNTALCSVQVEVQPLAPLNPTADPDPACAGDNVNVTVDPIPGATFTWTGPQGNYPNTNQITLFNLSQGNAGLYTVFATIGGCNSPLDSVLVQLARDPEANDDPDFEIDPGVTDTFTSVFLNDILSPASDFEITEVSALSGLQMLPDGTFIYTSGTEPGLVSFIYEVCSKSCPDLCDMAVVTIRIKDVKCSFIPNIFTPNGDQNGPNNFFVIPCIDNGLFGETNSLVVYNQWGAKVFEAAPYQNNWDGTLDGEPGKDLPDGTYFYIFKPGPTESTIKGFVHILR